MTPMKKILLVLITAGFSIPGCSQPRQTDHVLGEACEDCGLMYDGMPQSISWETKIAPAGEPGEPMVISGVIRKLDGTPAPGIMLYVYHTDNTGHYSRTNGQGNRHGHLRGWVKSDANGRYKFTSIRPASYPGRTDPAHIHPIIKEPNLTVYWIDEFLFDDDPKLTATVRSKQEKRGGSGIIHLTKNDKDVWVGQRDIVLGLNVPGYK